MEDVATIVAYLRTRVASLSTGGPTIAIVCGSGLSGLSERIQSPVRVAYSDIPFFPQSTVAGHGTELVFGQLGGCSVIAQRGRFHFYEGNSMSRVALPVRVFAALGCKVMIATNAAGGLNPAFRAGDVMVIRDHISLPCLTGAHPLTGPNDERFGPRFPPLTTAYSTKLQGIAEGVARSSGLGEYLRSGVYFHDSGPSYETPHEVAAMRILGGDAVGMSTVPEVIAAAHAGMAVLGLSLITNECRAPGDTGVAPTHEEVLAATEKRADQMQSLVESIVASIPLAEFSEPQVYQLFKGNILPPSERQPVSVASVQPFSSPYQQPATLPLLATAALAAAVGAAVAAAVTLALVKRQ